MFHVISHDGQRYGPADLATLNEWCRDGRIVADTRIVDPTGRETQARYVTGLGPFIAPPLAAMPAMHPMGYGVSQASKSKVAAIVLAFFVGVLGVHRFYLGRTGSGVAILLITVTSPIFCGLPLIVTSLWAFIDLILIASGALGDADGAPLV